MLIADVRVLIGEPERPREIQKMWELSFGSVRFSGGGIGPG